jgi:hypothetical protein
MLVTCGADLMVWKSRAVKTSVRKVSALSANSSALRLAANLSSVADPLTNGSGSGSCFCDLKDGNKNNFKFFCLLIYEVTFTSFCIIKKSQNSRNQDVS